MKWIIRIVLGLILLVVLLTAVVVFLVLSLDPNDHKDRISTLIEEQTGQELEIRGDIGLSLFPRLTLELGETTLSNAEGFSEPHFARVRKVDVGLALLPLLRKEVQVHGVRLEGLEVFLARDAQGRSNWEALLTAGEAPATPAPEVSPPASGVPGILRGLDVAGIDIRDASVHWRDEQAGTKLRIEPFNLQMGRLRLGEAAPLDMDLRLLMDDPQLSLHLQIKADLTMDPERGHYALRRIISSLDAQGDALPRSMAASIGGEFIADLRQDVVHLSKLDIKLDESTLRGDITVANLADPALDITLHLDRIDLDAYLPGTGERESGPAAPSGDGWPEEPLELPVDMLRGLNLRADIRIDHLKIMNLQLRDAVVLIQGRDGRLEVNSIKARLYEGHLDGNLGLDVSGRTPRFSAVQALKDVRFGALLQDLKGDAMVTGLANGRIQVGSVGNSVKEIIASLDGAGDMRVNDGAIKGINVAQVIRDADARLRGRTPAADAGPRQTDFTAITGTFVISKGVVTNSDLEGASPLLRVNGRGDVNLNSRRIDYRLDTRLVATLEGQDGQPLDELRNVNLPITIRGRWNEPRIGLDLQAVVGDRLKDEVEEAVAPIVDEHRDRLRQEVDSLQDRLRDRLR